jgi:hypothetical protein
VAECAVVVGALVALAMLIAPDESFAEVTRRGSLGQSEKLRLRVCQAFWLREISSSTKAQEPLEALTVGEQPTLYLWNRHPQ